MNRKKKALLLLSMFGAVLLTTASCTFRSHYQVVDEKATMTAVFLTQEIEDQKATISALVALLTPRPTVTLTPSPTPLCLVWTPSGICTTNPTLRRTPSGDVSESATSNSGVTGVEPISCSGLWRCYYSQSSQVLGQVRRGVTWEKEGDLYVLSGWSPKEGLSLSEDGEGGKTEGCLHGWGHYQSRRLRHTHIFDSQGRVLATIPVEMEFTVDSEASTLGVPNCQGVIVPTEGMIITLVERVKIP